MGHGQEQKRKRKLPWQMCGKEWRLEGREVAMKGKREASVRGDETENKLKMRARQGKAFREMLWGLESV